VLVCGAPVVFQVFPLAPRDCQPRVRLCVQIFRGSRIGRVEEGGVRVPGAVATSVGGSESAVCHHGAWTDALWRWRVRAARGIVSVSHRTSHIEMRRRGSVGCCPIKGGRLARLARRVGGRRAWAPPRVRPPTARISTGGGIRLEGAVGADAAVRGVSINSHQI